MIRHQPRSGSRNRFQRDRQHHLQRPQQQQQSSQQQEQQQQQQQSSGNGAIQFRHPFDAYTPKSPSPLSSKTVSSGVPIEILQRIASFPLFRAAPEGFLSAIAARLLPHQAYSQDCILTEGEEAKAIYWIVKGSVAVTSRDGESIYAQLSTGAFFGEIGILFNRPRTATIIAKTRCLFAVLTKDSLNNVLPHFPKVERVIRDEAQERIAILDKKKSSASGLVPGQTAILTRPCFSVSMMLKKLPLLSDLTHDALHSLALVVTLKKHDPFQYIVHQGTSGREIYFILAGTVEVVDEPAGTIICQLSNDSYFGEVTFLGLRKKRTASVRTVTSVECLVLSGEAFEKVIANFPKLRDHIYKTANSRLNQTVPEPNCEPADLGELPTGEADDNILSDHAVVPDPFSLGNETEDEVEKPSPSKSRRSSLAPPSPDDTPSASSSISLRESSRTAIIGQYAPIVGQNGRLPANVLSRVFMYLPLHELARLQRVCRYFLNIVRASPNLLQVLDLSVYNLKVNNSNISSIVALAAKRPKIVDISRCFYLSDDGFSLLINGMGNQVKTFRMRSCWEVSGMAIMDLASPNVCQNLEEIELSNCRKVGDYTMSHLLGMSEAAQSAALARRMAKFNGSNRGQILALNSSFSVGCSKLKRVKVRYCKHITDRTMAIIAANMADRLESLDLTRCTTITDKGFSCWSTKKFSRLTSLCLADCTFLTDQAIVSITICAENLRHVDLTFCCALSDVAVEVLALGCPMLQNVSLAFCGSAVSDNSLRCIALHLIRLQSLSIRGCIRATSKGVNEIISSAPDLKELNVSQCKNVTYWNDQLVMKKNITLIH